MAKRIQKNIISVHRDVFDEMSERLNANTDEIGELRKKNKMLEGELGAATHMRDLHMRAYGESQQALKAVEEELKLERARVDSLLRTNELRAHTDNVNAQMSGAVPGPTLPSSWGGFDRANQLVSSYIKSMAKGG